MNLSRRDFFSHMGTGLHGVALAALLSQDLWGSESSSPGTAARNFNDLRPRPPHIRPRARSVIQLFMHGGPSQVDLFDPKPELTQRDGQKPPRSMLDDLNQPGKAGNLMKSPFKFTQCGNSGIEISEALPFLQQHADDLCVIRSMHTFNHEHSPALRLMHTGGESIGRPTIGVWTVYGLGSLNQNLPAYVVLDDPRGLPVNGAANWQNGWLPTMFQGTRLRSQGEPMLNLQPADNRPDAVVERERELLAALDRRHQSRRPFDSRLEGRIANYEMAARMQLAATDAFDLSQETAATQRMYGVDAESETANYGRRCLLARRLVERGVRYVQLFIERHIWDAHSKLVENTLGPCRKTDQPVAALLTDLKDRGLLDETLVIWGGEFGRLPAAESPGRSAGRDHGPSGFTTWMAGGGLKRGFVYGATDEIGHRAVENPVSVHDFHATVLHLLGLDHHDLVYTQPTGRRDRITDDHPVRVVEALFA